MYYDVRRYFTATQADHIPGPPQGKWTYDDYAAIPEDGQRYEVIDGVLYVKPSIDDSGQGPLGLVIIHLIEYVDESRHVSGAFSIPFEVELSEETKVQPDLAVIFIKSGEGGKDHAIGAPDLVVEVTSPSSRSYDREQKYNAYASAGIKEYWIVDPVARNVEIFALEARAYQSTGTFSGTEIVRSKIIPDFPVHARQLFHISERPTNQS